MPHPCFRLASVRNSQLCACLQSSPFEPKLISWRKKVLVTLSTHPCREYFHTHWRDPVFFQMTSLNSSTMGFPLFPSSLIIILAAALYPSLSMLLSRWWRQRDQAQLHCSQPRSADFSAPTGTVWAGRTAGRHWPKSELCTSLKAWQRQLEYVSIAFQKADHHHTQHGAEKFYIKQGQIWAVCPSDEAKSSCWTCAMEWRVSLAE